MNKFCVISLLIIGVLTNLIYEYEGDCRNVQSSSLRTQKNNLLDGNDISICGTYSYRVCDWVYEFEFFGFPTRDPILVLSRTTEYEGDEEFEKVVSYSYSGSIKTLNNGVKKQMEVSVAHIYITFYKKPKYQCEEAVELQKEYDATTIHCKDESGNDPLETFKKLLDDGVKLEAEFMKKNMMMNNKKFTLVDKSGCTNNKDILEKLHM